MVHENHNGFIGGKWQESIDVRDFIQRNYREYTGDASFLAPATQRTKDMMAKVQELFKKERENGGVLDIDTETISSIVTYAPGYIDKENELIVGMQTDAPLKRGVNPFGGIRMAKQVQHLPRYTLPNCSRSSRMRCVRPQA